LLTSILRKTIAKKKEPFLFKPYDNNINFTEIPKEIGLYIHIPFCQTLCPYCPYNKIIYDKDRALTYKKALMAELQLLREHLNGKRITSIYIGGGTPTLMLGELQEVLDWIRINLTFKGDLGIEIYPHKTDHNIMAQLKEMGVNLVSIGVQTFNDRQLSFLGRRYNGNEARKIIELIKSADFACVDVDIMFNLPNQSKADIEHDISSCYSLDIDQLSIYPLIVFPLTPLYHKIKKERLHTFNRLQEYGLLRRIEELSDHWRYDKTSIWTYGKRNVKRYTSITRESFVGIGASATSLFGDYFYLNTFQVEAYIRRLLEGRLPINLVNVMSPRERMVFWLFWRCYDTSIDTGRFRDLFGQEFNREFPVLERLLPGLGLAVKHGKKLELTRQGAYLYHLVEKQYSVTYLNNMWEACMKSAWLEKIAL
jgi:oxygen-independent coproporphyrinogen-3 oxidase